MLCVDERTGGGALLDVHPDDLLRPLDGRPAKDAQLPPVPGAAPGARALVTARQEQDLSSFI